MDFEYVRNNYGVPACAGRRVVAYGKPGVIVADRGNYIGINLDCDPPDVALNYHPTDGIVYGEMGTIRKTELTRAQRRYQEYLRSPYYEAGDSFADFLGIRKREARHE